MDRNLSTDLSRAKAELTQPSKVSPLEMVTVGLCLRIQETVRNQLISYSRAVHMLSFLEHWMTFIIDLQNIALSFSQSLIASRSVVINSE